MRRFSRRSPPRRIVTKAGAGRRRLEAAKVAIDATRGSSRLFDRDRFTFLGVRVLDTDWRIERSNIGLPLAQWKKVMVIARREGLTGCLAFPASINHANLGGSKYAKEWGSVSMLSEWTGVKCPDGKK